MHTEQHKRVTKRIALSAPRSAVIRHLTEFGCISQILAKPVEPDNGFGFYFWRGPRSDANGHVAGSNKYVRKTTGAVRGLVQPSCLYR